MIQGNPAIVWLRQDLRLADNSALQAVSNHPFFALYIWDENDPYYPGGVFIGIVVMSPTLLIEIKKLKRPLKMKEVLLKVSTDLSGLSLGKFKRR